LEPCGDFCGLLEIFIGRAPEEQAAGDAADRDRNTHLCSYPEDAVLHRGGTRASGIVRRVAVLSSDWIFSLSA